MEKRDTIRSLIDAEMSEYSEGAYADHGSARDQLERFAALVAAAEREACAKVCESEWSNVAERMYGEECAAAIRARGNA